MTMTINELKIARLGHSKTRLMSIVIERKVILVMTSVLLGCLGALLPTPPLLSQAHARGARALVRLDAGANEISGDLYVALDAGLVETARDAAMQISSQFSTAEGLPSFDFDRFGGLYSLANADEARAFFARWGFVVFTEVMSGEENSAVLDALVQDLHEINPATRSSVTTLQGFEESDLPTSPNHSFRTTCNIVFGRFASSIRANPSVRAAFAALHGVPAEELGVSWDTLFYTSQAHEVSADMATQLHWDHNGYCGGRQHKLAETLCTQAVYYASRTDARTPAFACSPGSHAQWRDFSESDRNPAKRGSKLLNYLPLEAFDGAFVERSGLAHPVRVEVPAASLLVWDARLCHGNTPPASRAAGPQLGRVSLAICFHPVAHRTAAVQKDALVKALGGVRTTHHPAVMLSHNKQGYPVDWTAQAEAEHNAAVRNLAIPLNPDVSEDDFQSMVRRASLSDATKARLLDDLRLSLGNVQQLMYDSYWGRDGLEEADVYEPMGALKMRDLRRLVHPIFEQVQGMHPAELSGELD